MLLAKCASLKLVYSTLTGNSFGLNMADNFLIREATPADYKAVMDINRNVYYGLDYLPVWYHIFLQSPDCHCFVYELNGKIVSI